MVTTRRRRRSGRRKLTTARPISAPYSSSSVCRGGEPSRLEVGPQHRGVGCGRRRWRAETDGAQWPRFDAEQRHRQRKAAQVGVEHDGALGAGHRRAALEWQMLVLVTARIGARMSEGLLRSGWSPSRKISLIPDVRQRGDAEWTPQLALPVARARRRRTGGVPRRGPRTLHRGRTRGRRRRDHLGDALDDVALAAARPAEQGEEAGAAGPGVTARARQSALPNLAAALPSQVS